MSIDQQALPNVLGRYQVAEELGHGAMGIVYLAVDPVIARPVAIKVVKHVESLPPAELAQYRDRFRHEAEAAGRLGHPDIVRIYDIGPDYIVMEYIEGRPLAVALKGGGAFTVRQIVALLMRIADAIDYAHRNGVVHRDIKPANVMLLDDGGVKVMDFGVARLEDSKITAVGTVLGSVRYMAPEQMRGETVDGRADNFSLATVAYELLTGQAPFPGKTITEVVSRVMSGSHQPPCSADTRLPAAIEQVFRRAFAPKPQDRYPRAMDFARDLADALKSVLELHIIHKPQEDVPTEAGAPGPQDGISAGPDDETLAGGGPLAAAAPAAPPAASSADSTLTFAPSAVSPAGAASADATISFARADAPGPGSADKTEVMSAASMPWLRPDRTDRTGQEAPSPPPLRPSPEGEGAAASRPEALRAPAPARPGLETEVIARSPLAPAVPASPPSSSATQPVRVQSLPPTARTQPVERPAFARTLIMDSSALRREAVLMVDADPEKAEVWIDGMPVGVAPVSQEIGFGRHVVRLEAKGREPVSLDVDLRPDRPMRSLSVSLPEPREHGGEVRPGQFVPFGPEVTPPSRDSGDLPAYPPEARQAGLEGAPVVEVWIGEKGDVVDLAIVESAGAILDGALLQAVAGWRFRPARYRGVPVSVRVTVQHHFRL